MAGPGSTRYRYDVFLSHSSADKPVVRDLAERLKAAGLRVWFDEWIIRPGDHISSKIEEGLEHSAVLLFCMSANAFGSDWVQLESHTAIFRDPLNRERRFLPLRLDDATIKAMLRGYAYLDWRPEADRQREWGRLLEACGGDGGEDHPVPPVPPPKAPDDAAHAPADAAPAASRDPPPPARPGQTASSASAPRVPPEANPPRALDLFHPGPVTSVCWSPDGERLASGGDDGTVRLWEAGSGRELAVLVGHWSEVWSVCWSPDGECVVSGGGDGTVRLWEVGSGAELAVLEGHRGEVLSVGWSPDGDRVASGGRDGTVRLWEAGSGRELAVLEGHKYEVWSVCWGPDGGCLASGGGDGTVRLWEAGSGGELAVLTGHKHSVRSVCWSPDGECVVSGGGDGTVRLWEVGSGAELAVLAGHGDWVRSVCWSPDGERVASAGDDGTVRLWEAGSGRELAVLEGHSGWVWSVCWSPDGELVASAGDDGTVRLWEAGSGREVAVLHGHRDCVLSVCWSPDGERVASSGGRDGAVRVWDARGGEELLVLDRQPCRVLSVCWSPDGERVAGAGEHGTAWLWEASSGRELLELESDQPCRVLSVCWSPDGERVASGGEDGALWLWEAGRGGELAVLDGHHDWVLSVCWSPDGERVVSGGRDGTVRLWEACSGREMAVLEGHRGEVFSVGWSPDGERVVSGGRDGTVRLWEACSGRELAVLDGHQAGVLNVGWSPDGGIWASGSFCLVLIWSADQLLNPAKANDTGSRIYTNAKVLVVGASGAGKSALTRRLATGSFQESGPSTVGAWCTQWPLPQPAAAGVPEREVWLWDFGGQADQRLIHQLFLDRAALVLLLFNAESDQVIDGLLDWQTALRRTLSESPPQLLVAARTDAGFGASRSKLQQFAADNGCLYIETSALTGKGCPELTAAIAATIPWDQLPRHTSPLLFQQLKAEILRLRDGGETLLTYKDLRERLRQRVPGLDDPSLRTVLGLLDGPGVLRQLDFGDYVLLKPEWLGAYGQAVARALKQAEPQLGALPLGAISAAALPLSPDQQRLEPSEESVLLAELERQLQERRICLRQGSRLVFPSFCGLERPASPALPPRFMSYDVRGWLDDIYATLVVSLEETRVFRLQELWRGAAEFRTVASAGVPGGQALAVQLHRHHATEGTITVHTAAGLSLTEQAQFAQLIHGHLRQAADSVERRRHWLCPYCHIPNGNEAELMAKLERLGEQARVFCVSCDKPFPLYDELERMLADPLLRHQAEALGAETPQLTSRRKGKLLMLEVGARLTSANQKWHEISADEDDGIDLQVEFTDDDGNGSGRYLSLQLKAGSSHLRRRADGREMFAIRKPRWIHTWTQQPGPVMLVIGREADAVGLDHSILGVPGIYDLNEQELARLRKQLQGTSRFETRAFPDVRWMEISSVLRRELAAGRRPEQIRQIEFTGETLDLASVLRWRRRILAPESLST